jgi:hypothetical protein
VLLTRSCYGNKVRIWGSGVRISSGAPPSTHLRTRFTGGLSGNLILGGFKRRLCAVPLGFEVVEPVLEDVIEVGYAVLDKPVEPLELVLSLMKVSCSCARARVMGSLVVGEEISAGKRPTA